MVTKKTSSPMLVLMKIGAPWVLGTAQSMRLLCLTKFMVTSGKFMLSLVHCPGLGSGTLELPTGSQLAATEVCCLKGPSWNTLRTSLKLNAQIALPKLIINYLINKSFLLLTTLNYTRYAVLWRVKDPIDNSVVGLVTGALDLVEVERHLAGDGAVEPGLQVARPVVLEPLGAALVVFADAGYPGVNSLEQKVKLLIY